MADNNQIIPTDGDTFNDPERGSIRVRGVNTPENTSYSARETGGWQATQFTRQFLRDGYELGEQDGETYGREVRDVANPEGDRLSDSLIRHNLGGRTSWSDSQQGTAEALGVADDVFGRESTDPEYRALRDSARQHRAGNLERFLNGEFSERTNEGNYKYLGDEEGVAGRSFDRGVAELRASGNAFIDAVGGVVGSERMQQFGEKGVQEAMLDAARNPAEVASWEDVDGLADAGMFVLENLIAESPSIGLDIAAAVGTGGTSLTLSTLGKGFLRRMGGPNAATAAGEISSQAFSRGAKAGAFGSLYTQNAGGTHMDQQSVGVDNSERALILGLGKTTLDYASLKGILGDVGKRFGDGEEVDSIAKWFGSTLATASTSAAREGVTETTQALIDELNKVDLTDGRYQLDANRIIEGMVVGSSVGGTLGGAGAAAGNTYQMFRGNDAAVGGGPMEEATSPEPPEDLAAQVESRPNDITYLSPANVDDEVTLAYLRERYPNLHVKRTENGGLKVSQSAEAVANASTAVDETTQASELGYDQNKDEAMAAAAEGGQPVVEQRVDERGNVTHEQVKVADPNAVVPPGVRRLTPEQSQASRAERYGQQVDALRARQAQNQPAATTAEVEGYQSTTDRRAAARFEFAPPAPVADLGALADQASDMGIDPSQFVEETAAVNENVLRRDLQSRLGDIVPNQDVTLRDALDGRQISDLDAANLRELAQAMGLKDLPKKARAFDKSNGAPKQQRLTAINAVSNKLMEWRDGMRLDRGRDGTKQAQFVDQLAPSDVSLMAGVVPGLEGIKRGEFGNNADYQTAIRDAISEAFPTQQSLRQHLASLDDPALIEAVQMTRANQAGLSFETETDDRAMAGRLQQAVAGEQATSKVNSGERRATEGNDRAWTDPRPTAYNVNRPDEQPADANLDAEWDDAFAGENPLAEDGQRKQEVMNAAAAASIYDALTGQNEGPGYRSLVEALTPALADNPDQRANVRPTMMDGRKLVDRLVQGSVDRANGAEAKQRVRQEAEDQLRQGALDNPTAFAQQLARGFQHQGLPLSDFIVDSNTNRTVPGETASASGVSNTRIQDRGEQESSDYGFFIGLLDGARFGVNQDGELVPASPLDPKSTLPEQQQRLESLNRTLRLQDDDRSNLIDITTLARTGDLETYKFDAVALSNYAQGGYSKPDSPAQAYLNLLDNVARMASGPQTAAHQTGGERAAYIQTLNEFPFIPESKVVYEGTSGPVTFGEARRQFYQERSDNQARADLARELDSINERQTDRRRALRLLIDRALNGLGNLEGEARLATIRDINDALYQTDNDSLANVVTASETMTDAEFGDVILTLMSKITSEEARLSKLESDLPRLEKAAYIAQVEADFASIQNRPAASEVEQVAHNEARTLAVAQREADELRISVPRRRARLDEVTKLRPEVKSEPLDMRGVGRYKSVAGSYSLTERQAGQFPGTQGTRSLPDLLSDYRRERDRATTLGKELDGLGRLASYTERALDVLAKEIEEGGADRDTARAEAEKLYTRIQGTIGSEGTGHVGDTDVEGDMSEGGQPFIATVNEQGIQSAVRPDTSERSDDFQDGPVDSRDAALQDDEIGRVVFEAMSFKRQLRADLEARVAAFKEASGEVTQVADGNAPTHEGRLSFYEGVDYSATDMRAPRIDLASPYASEAHRLAYQKYQAAKRVQSAGIPLPQTPRPAILHAAFGDEGMRIIGADDSSAVESFVSQAVSDFRSTGRPVMVTVGESAQQIGQHLENHRLLKNNQRKRAIRQLEEAQAGNRALYMPMGDFVLVSLPLQPKRGRSQAANLRWYHQLGHELGHMVFDDYSQALASNRAQREAVYAAFEAQTEITPDQDPTLFKEWFADQAANEMIDRSLGMADPQNVTPFTRLANMLEGLWERIQYLLPRFTRTRAFAQFAVRIRAGQLHASRSLDATDDFTIENYDGATQANANKATLMNTRMKAFAKSQTAPGSVGEAIGRLGRTVVGRLESYSPEMASHLFQRSASDRNARNTQAYAQAANSNRDRWVGVMETAFGKVYQAKGIKGALKGKEKQAAVIEAFRDFEAGRTHKRGAAALAEAMRAVTQNARQNGFRSAQLDGSKPPVSFDHNKVDAERQVFSDLMRETFLEAGDHELGQRLELLLDSQGQSEFAIAPGLPVSYHDTTRRMVDAVGTDRLRELGFLSEPSDAVFYYFIDGLAKRTAWEANFGDYTDTHANPRAHHRRTLGVDDPNGSQMESLGLLKEGRYYNPNGQFNRMMESVVAEHGQSARVDILKMLDGVFGRTTSAMPRGLRNINDWVTAWTGWTVLAFSGVASIPEIGLPAVRAHGRAGMIDGFRGYREAREFAKAAGNVLSDSAERIVWQSMGDNYESSTLNKIGTTFFKLNGQKAITDVSRIMGISIGTQYLIRSAEVGDAQALKQLGVTVEDVRNWDADGRKPWTPGADPSVNATSEKVQSALTQFMYEGSSYPSKFQNPSWFNNPYLKMFWMIKRYMYAYGEGILMGMWRQMKRQWVRGQGLGAEQRAFMAAAPFMAFAVATIPLAAAGTELREWMRPVTTGRDGKTIDEYGGVAKYSQYLFSRAGGFGPLEVLLSARQQSDWGASPLGAVSPVIAKAEMLVDWGADGSLSASEAANKIRKVIPVASQFSGVVNKIFD